MIFFNAHNAGMFILLILCVVATVILFYWLADRFIYVWNSEGLSDKAVLITGCDVNEIAREIALMLDKNGVPVFACYSNETNADYLKYVVRFGSQSGAYLKGCLRLAPLKVKKN